MDSLEKLIQEFRKFPGIGPRQARRFAYHILHSTESEAQELSQLIVGLKKGIAVCSKCFRFFSQKNENATTPLCSLCLDPNRDQQTLMILSQDTDIAALEQRKIYNGLYFIVGKHAELSSFDPISIPRLKDLENRVLHDSTTDAPLKEIILAMNANTEGEHTAAIIEKNLKLLTQHLPKEQKPVTTILGRGLSTGTELEYSDAETLKSAIENRRVV